MEAEQLKWNFPLSNHTSQNGFDTADVQTFSGNPLDSLARESVQNSSDARKEGSEKPVHVEFVTQEVAPNDIPGIEEIRKQLERCRNLQGYDKKTAQIIDKMETILNSTSITILRISDHNTSGLTGAGTNDNNSKWFGLIKRSGSSNKTSGDKMGSKGIGKFASFACSGLRMVFYSTLTEDGKRAYEGVCRFCSGGTGRPGDDWTQGVGYYTGSEMNDAILGEFNAPWAYRRQPGDSGTDVYVIAFNNTEEGWENAIISNVLNSFVYAVSQGEFEFSVNGREISKDTLEQALMDPRLKLSDSVLAQLDCLNKQDPTVQKTSFQLSIPEFHDSKITLLVKKYTYDQVKQRFGERIHSYLAYIRYPYMKIKEKTNPVPSYCAAMLILNKGKLASALRDIENPKHNAWETNRIEDKNQRSLMREVIDSIDYQAKEEINKIIGRSAADETDFAGAADIIPDFGSIGDVKRHSQETNEKSVIGKEHISSIEKTTGYDTNENDSGVLEPTIGGVDEDEEGNVSFPTGDHNSPDTPEHPHPGEGKGELTEGEHIVFTIVKSGSTKSRMVCADKANGIYRVQVKAFTNVDEARIKFIPVDETGKPAAIAVLSCQLNNIDLPLIEKDTFANFSLESNKTYVFTFKLNTKEFISGRIELYAHR